MESIPKFLLLDNSMSYSEKYQYLLDNITSFDKSNIIPLDDFRSNLLSCISKEDVNLLISIFFPLYKVNVKMVYEGICSKFTNKYTDLGIKISKSLIRVAATRIFSDPEQSIMELPVNSIDSYNSRNKNFKSIGKFGVGLFSFIYWLNQTDNGKYNRSLSIESTSRVNGKMVTYVCFLNWSINGLKCTTSFIYPKKKTGTKISLFCELFPLTDLNILKMHKYLDRLSFVEDIEIKCNGYNINSKKCVSSSNKINILLNTTLIEIEDFAYGIEYDLIWNTLLIPTSSTKIRSIEVSEFIQPSVFTSSENNYILRILVSNICLIELKILSDEIFGREYNIYLPFNSKLPVSRDDIVYEKDSIEINHFINAFDFLISYSIKTDKNIYYLVTLIKNYAEINKSPYLSSSINKLIFNLSLRNEIFVKNTIFWRNFIKDTSLSIPIVLYDSSLMFDAEFKFINEIKKTTQCNSKIFDSRIVVLARFLQRGVIENGGFISVIFIRNVKDDVKTVIMTHRNSLLIPYGTKFEVKLLESYPIEFKKILILLYMTFKKKTINFYNNLTSHFLKDTIHSILSHNFEINFKEMFLTMLCSKIADAELKVVYGHNFYVSNSLFFSYSNWENYGHLSKRVYVPKYDEKLMNFFIKCIPLYHTGKFVLPHYSDFQILTNENKFIDEFKLLDDYCIGDAELFILNLILRELEINMSEYINLSGILVYILEEMRRVTNNFTLEYEIVAYQESGSNDIKQTLYNKVIERCVFCGLKYLKLKNKRKSITIKKPEIINGELTSCKHLIHKCFMGEDNFIPYHFFDRNHLPLQIVEIAINDGTNKPFIPSIMTELIQNSLDIIRMKDLEYNFSKNKKLIEINIGSNSISIKDHCGISDILQILIPFLSSKNPDDPNVTGEIGTGFFNVYRQPFTKNVRIETVYDNIKTIVLCKPLVLNNIVIDVEYQILKEILITDKKLNELDNENIIEPYTEITLIINDNIEIISSLTIEAYLFAENYISLIDLVDIYIEGTKRNISLYEVYSDSKIGKFSIVENDQKIIPSFVLTNDVPFLCLSDLSIISPELHSIIDKFASTCVVLNLNKNVYIPSQSRNKLTIYPELITEVEEFIYNGIIRCIFSKYVTNRINIPDEIIDHSLSEADIFQLKPSTETNQFVKYIFNEKCDDGIFRSVGETIIYYIKRFYTGELKYFTELRTNTLYEKVIYRWFLNKSLKQKSSIQTFHYKNIPKKFLSQKLTLFAEIYWNKVRILIDQGQISDITLYKPPEIYFVTPLESLGIYDCFTNKIELDENIYNKKDIEDKIIELSKKDLDFLEFHENTTLLEFFSVGIPACTFIHELTHALFHNSHNDGESSHGKMNIIINGERNLEFDEVAIKIYTMIISNGLFTEFFNSLKNSNDY